MASHYLNQWWPSSITRLYDQTPYFEIKKTYSMHSSWFQLEHKTDFEKVKCINFLHMDYILPFVSPTHSHYNKNMTFSILMMNLYPCIAKYAYWYSKKLSVSDSTKSKCHRNVLTHWGRDKIDAIFQMIFKCISLNENIWISNRISLKFVPKSQINDIPALVQIMAWRLPGNKPLSETMMVSLLTHMCVTQPQWVKRMSIWFAK